MSVAGKRAWMVGGALALAGAAYFLVRALGQSDHEAAQAALERQNFRLAAQHLDKCLQAKPGDPALLLLAAQTARRRGDLAKAQEHLQACEDADKPPSGVALEKRLLRAQQGDVKETEQLLALCLDSAQTPETPLILEAAVEAKLKVMERAFLGGMGFNEGPGADEAAKVRRAIAAHAARGRAVEKIQGLVWQGRIHLITGEREKAVASFRSALEQDAERVDARFHLAGAISEDAPEESARHLETLVRQDPANQQARFILAAVRRGLGRAADAAQLLDTVLAANPKDLQALLARGQVALDAERPEEAEPFFRRALAVDPNEPGCSLGLSHSLHLQGKVDEAKEHQERYRQLAAERSRARTEGILKSKTSKGNPSPKGFP